jgi:predicted HTH transcriptional regulator
VPYSSLASVIEQRRDAYHLALLWTHETMRGPAPDWQPWLTFLPESLHEQKTRLAQHLERERQFLDDLPRLSAQILEVCRERGRVTVADAVKATGVSRNTIKDHLKALRLAGHIELHGAGRGSWYSPA